MNTVILRGIPHDIKYSHSIGPVDYYQCNFVVSDPSRDNNVIIVKFKQFSNKFIEGQETQVLGNLRSYTSRQGEKTKVVMYVFTYQDNFDNVDEDFNYVELDGRICKKDTLWKNEKTGKHSYHCILANNIYTEDSKINSYIACVAYGKTAVDLSELDVNSQVKIIGEIRSRTYTKQLNDGDIEIRVAHEVVVKEFQKLS